ncbi:MAG: hypothetical protein GPJ54_09990 [Candidatus Heimdallarchaeota archaeon]|nr:hypothetical protein [Candidatus Heimdallarchaeota archaeon]
MNAKINFEESLTQYLDAKGEMLSSNCKGKLVVQNASSNTTLWSIKLDGELGSDVINFEKQEISHIQAGKDFETYYKVVTDSKLKLTERIDTSTNDETNNLNEENDTLITYETQKVMFEISLFNGYSFTLTDIELLKQLDSSCLEFRVLQPYVGSIMETENAFIWKLESLAPNSEIKIRIIANLKPTTSDPVPTGEINIRAKAIGQLSSLKPTIFAECDNVDLSVEINETQDPGNWEIKTEYTNNSEFATLLNKIQLKSGEQNLIDEVINTVFDADPGGEAWKREGPSWHKNVNLQSAEYPVIEKEYDYNVVYDTGSEVTIALNKENDYLRVVEISVEKQFNPQKINTYTRTPLLYTLQIQNIGTAVIDKLQFEDIVPPYLIISSVEVDGDPEIILNAKIADQEGLDQSIIEYVDRNEEIPDSMSISDPRKLFIDLIMSSFFPGSQTTLRINGISEKPKPNLDYSAPSTVTAYPFHASQGFRTKGLTENKSPELIVSYAKRSFKDRVTYNAMEEGKYEISLLIVNNGNVPLENLKITQDISGAKYQSHLPAVVNVEDRQNEVEFSVSEIAIEQEVLIKMIVVTSGPLRQKQPIIRIEKATESRAMDLGSAITAIMGMYPELYRDNEEGKMEAEKDLLQFNSEAMYSTQNLREFSVKVITPKLKDLPADTTTFEFKTSRGVKDETIREELKMTRLYNPPMIHTIFRPDGTIKLKEYDLLSIGSDYFAEHSKKHPPMLNSDQEIVWENKLVSIYGVLQILLEEESQDKPTREMLQEKTYKAFVKKVWDITANESMIIKLHEIIKSLA